MTVLILSSIDFWVVKNITGRLIVGLRWKNQVKDNGETQWIFESMNKKKQANFDTRFFWVINYVYPAIWLYFFITKILSLTIIWANLTFICLFMGVINAYGFFKCDAGSID